MQADDKTNGTAPEAATEQPAAKRQRRTSGNEWLRSWAWKREHRPDKVRFDRPYIHPMALPGSETEAKLTVHQARFKEQGFASTVWDSSIVLAKFFERQAATIEGKRCLDLSAGCGLPGLVLSRLGAGAVVATDLAPNLPLLRKNAEANGCAIEVLEHSWGEDVAPLSPPFDIIAACDVMYVAEAVEPLVASLCALSGPETRVYISHGRNRQAEPQFLAAAGQHFDITTVPPEDLHEVYQCADVDVLLLTLKQHKDEQQGEWATWAQMDRRRPEAEGEQRAAKRLSVPLLLPPPRLPPAAPRPLQPYNPQLPDPLQPGRLLQPLPRGTAYGLWRQLGASPLPLPPPRPQAPVLSPGWPACSPEKSKEASEDATSPRAAAGVHVLAADIREASTSGRVSGSVEKAVFMAAGAGGGAVNPSLATRNRKTELDLEEPSPAVRRLVQAFEGLLPPLAAAQGGAGLMQEAWTALLGRVLTGASISDQLSCCVLHQPVFAGERLTQARLALADCAVQADAVLAGLCKDDAALAALEAMQRVAIRLSLPFYSIGGALHVFPWLEQAIYTHAPSLRPAGLAGQPAYQPATSGVVNAGLAQLAAVHEALEDVTRGLPEAAREAAAVGVLAAAGAAVMRAHMRAGAADELLALRCLQPLSPTDAGKIRALVSGVLQTLAPLTQGVRKLAAAAELLERAARSMRLPADGWARAMWAVLSTLRL